MPRLVAVKKRRYGGPIYYLRCPRCCRTLHHECFSFSKTGRRGILGAESVCKECSARRYREWYHKNKARCAAGKRPSKCSPRQETARRQLDEILDGLRLRPDAP